MPLASATRGGPFVCEKTRHADFSLLLVVQKSKIFGAGVWSCWDTPRL